MDTVSKLLDTASVKRLALEHGFDKVGMASAEDFDFPAWVHSAIVLGYAALDVEIPHTGHPPAVHQLPDLLSHRQASAGEDVVRREERVRGV